MCRQALRRSRHDHHCESLSRSRAGQPAPRRGLVTGGGSSSRVAERGERAACWWLALVHCGFATTWPYRPYLAIVDLARVCLFADVILTHTCEEVRRARSTGAEGREGQAGR